MFKPIKVVLPVILAGHTKAMQGILDSNAKDKSVLVDMELEHLERELTSLLETAYPKKFNVDEFHTRIREAYLNGA